MLKAELSGGSSGGTLNRAGRGVGVQSIANPSSSLSPSPSCRGSPDAEPEADSAPDESSLSSEGGDDGSSRFAGAGAGVLL
jgi:hypothetical protein